jgi:hypothetical protein
MAKTITVVPSIAIDLPRASGRGSHSSASQLLTRVVLVIEDHCNSTYPTNTLTIANGQWVRPWRKGVITGLALAAREAASATCGPPAYTAPLLGHQLVDWADFWADDKILWDLALVTSRAILIHDGRSVHDG